jgi:hypothetical protein
VPAHVIAWRELRNRWFADSALEGSGFEPSVPLPKLSSVRAVRAEIIGRSTDVFRRDREFDVSALQGRPSSQSQCSTDPGLIAGTWHRPLFLTRDRWLESTSLQRGVRCEPDFRDPAPQKSVVRLVVAASYLARVPGRSGRAEGPVLNVMGRVLNLSGEPVRTPKVEVWQANAEIARVAVHAPVRQAPGALAGADHPQANGYDLVKVDPTGRLLAVWISFSAATTTRAYSLHRRRRRSL